MPNNTGKMNAHKVTKTIVTSPNIYKPVGPYRLDLLFELNKKVGNALKRFVLSRGQALIISS